MLLNHNENSCMFQLPHVLWFSFKILKFSVFTGELFLFFIHISYIMPECNIVISRDELTTLYFSAACNSIELMFNTVNSECTSLNVYFFFFLTIQSHQFFLFLP